MRQDVRCYWLLLLYVFFIVIAKNIICHETRGPSLCAVCMISQYVHVLLGVPDISPQPKHIYEG